MQVKVNGTTPKKQGDAALKKFLGKGKKLKVTDKAKNSPAKKKKGDTDAVLIKKVVTPFDEKYLELRVIRSMVEHLVRLETEWVEHGSALRIPERGFGEEAVKSIKADPCTYYDACPYLQYRKEKKALEISIKNIPEALLIKMDDECNKVEEDRRVFLKQQRKEEREKLEAAAKDAEKGTNGSTRKKQKTETVGKAYKLKECCAMYSSFDGTNPFGVPDELGVLNMGVNVRVDISTIKGSRVQIVHPMKAWAQVEDLPIGPDDLAGVVFEKVDDESDGEPDEPENSVPDIFNTITCQKVVVYRKRKQNPRYELGILHAGNKIEMDKNNGLNGWIRLISPITGWALREELKPAPLTKEELKILEKAKPKVKKVLTKSGGDKEDGDKMDTDKAAETPKEGEEKAKGDDAEKMDVDKETKEPEEAEAEKEDEEEVEILTEEQIKNGKVLELRNWCKKNGLETKGTKSVIQKRLRAWAEKKRKEVAEKKPAAEKTTETKETDETETKEGDKAEDAEMADADKKKAEEAEKAAKEAEAKKKAEEEKKKAEEEKEENWDDLEDLDWTPVENLDPATITGVWSTGQKGGCFHFNQNDDGVIDGFLENKETCSIEGKIDGNDMTFKQIWQKGSVHGTGVVTVVDGVCKDNFRTIDLSFECKNKDGKAIKGKNTLRKRPVADISGVWYAEGEAGDLGKLTLKMETGGAVSGFMDDSKVCKITGRVAGHLVKIKQEWQTEPKKFSTEAEGYVNDEADKMTIKWTHTNGNGESVDGTRTFRKLTARAVSGLWVSGDRGGKFVIDAHPHGIKFKGYLDSSATCQIAGTCSGFTIKFKQKWLSSSAHSGAVADVTGKANTSFTKLDLEFSCKKPDGTKLSGRSTLSRESKTKSKKFANELFVGTHKGFPANVYNRMDGARASKLFPGQIGIGSFPLYSRTQKILVLGEADFSFTLAMAREFKKTYNVLIGSSYMLKWGEGKPPPTWNLDARKRQFLNEQQKLLDPTLDEIKERGGQARFGVDARNIAASLTASADTKWARPVQKMIKFDRIVFPFPRSSLSRFDRVEDTDLMRGLFRSAQKNLTPNGELHVILHTSRQALNQFDLWCVRELAEQENMRWVASLPFDPKKMPRYQPKDVTGTPWRPFEPMLNIFVGRYSDWQPHTMMNTIR